jgi:hypothetical protein
MIKKILLLLLFLGYSWNAFGGLKIKYGSKSFTESPSTNIDSVNYYGAALDFGIPFFGIDLLLDYQIGEEKEGSESIAIEETSYGIRKEFLVLVKPFVGLGVSNNKIEYTNLVNRKISKRYTGNWISAGVNIAAAVVQAGIEYRADTGREVDFDNSDRSVNLASSSRSIYFGFGFGF